MLRKTTLMAALAVSFLSTTAHAAEHIILIMPDAYFPATSYVSAGDTLRFVNETEGTINVISEGNEWSTGDLSLDQEATVGVSQDMKRGFYHEGVFDDNGDPLVTGILHFGAAPIN
ncbi:MAG: plastocyanin [Ascidiaceihabitans sp.]|jgi:plastocyanin